MKIVIINALILFLAATLTAMVGYGTAPDATLDNLDPSLIIIAPNGGENLYGGENTSLTWTATDWRIPLAAVQIWFSSTGGDSYQLVVGGADNTGSYSWQIPELETNEALIKIRVTDSVGNYSEQVSASVFSISHTPPAAPQFVAAQILDQTDLLISWQAVTSTVISTPMTPDGFLSNNAGGILGGMASGQEIVLRAAVKPIPSIALPQQTVNRTGQAARITIGGRHDICAIPRIVPVLKAMTLLTLADFVLLQRRVGR